MKKEDLLYIVGGVLIGIWIGYKKYNKTCPKQIDCNEGMLVSKMNEYNSITYPMYKIQNGKKTEVGGQEYELILSDNGKTKVTLVDMDFLNKYPTV